MAKLVVVQGPASGKQYPLERREVVLGRHPEVDFPLDAPDVSRRHARVYLENERYILEDLGSINGTYVNSTRLEGHIELHPSDQIKIGPFLLMFESAAPSTSEQDVIIRAEVTANASNINLFKQDASTKLQAVLEISKQMARSLVLDDVLPKLLDQLLLLFRQADRGVILLREGDHLVVRAQRTRREERQPGPMYSRTVVSRVMSEGIGIVAEDAGTDQRFNMAQTLNALGIRSFLCVPFKSHDDKPLGVLQLDRFGLGLPFTMEDLNLLTAIALQASVVLENAALHVDLLRQERFKRELALAREIQEGFLAQDFAPLAKGGVELFAQVYPAREVSGDYYDFFPLDEQRLAFSVGDVSGKGMPAALFMIAVRTLGRHLAQTARSPAAVLQVLNDSIAADNVTGMFVTMAFGIYDAATGEVVLSNGGHPLPLVRRHGAAIEKLALPPGRLLGFSKGVLPLEDIRVVLHPGDLLLLFTDGVTEALAPDGKTMFGDYRLESTVAGLTPGQSVKVWADQIKNGIDLFTRSDDLNDDITLLLLRRPSA